MNRSLLHGDYILRTIFVVLLTLWGVGGVSAQECKDSYDGGVQSIIGTDFDFDRYNEDLEGQYSPIREVNHSYSTTLGGVRILPDMGPAPCRYNIAKFSAIDAPQSGYVKNAYFVTDSLVSMYGNNPYSIVPQGNDGNSFFVMHNLNGAAGGVLSFYFPYLEYRGRDVEVVIKYYVGNKGMTTYDLANAKPVDGAPYGDCVTCAEGSAWGVQFFNPKVNPTFDDNGRNYDFVGQNFGNDKANGYYISQTIRSNMQLQGDGTMMTNRGSYIDVGTGNGFGATGHLEVEYLGDPNYGFIPKGNNITPRVSGVQVQRVNPTSYSNGQWYGWYEARFTLSSADYGAGSGLASSYFDVYMNISNISLHDFVAMDYINVKTAHVCASVKKYCPNEEVRLTPFYYQSGHQLEWQEMVVYVVPKNDPMVGHSGYIYSNKKKVSRSVILAGDTVIIKEYNPDFDWVAIDHTTANNGISVLPSKSAYNAGYTYVYRAIDLTQQAENEHLPEAQRKLAESFEIWLAPNPNCTPGDLGEDIIGDTEICASSTPWFKAVTSSGDEVDPRIIINWKVTRLDDGQDYTAYLDSAKGDPSVVNAGFGPAGLFHNTYLKVAPGNFPEGDYRISYSQSMMYLDEETGVYYEGEIPNSTVAKVIHVYNAPDPKITLISNTDATVCASDTTGYVEFLLTDEREHFRHYLNDATRKYYDYTLHYSGGDDVNSSSAGYTVVTPTEEVSASAHGVDHGTRIRYRIGSDNICDKASLGLIGNIALTVDGVVFTEDGNPIDQCFASIKQNMEVKNPGDLEVICKSLQEEQYAFNASEDALDTTIVLPMPAITGGCDSDPMVEIKVDGAPYANVHVSAVTRGEITLKLLVGVASTVTYTVADGCGHTSSCDQMFLFADVSSPKCHDFEQLEYVAKKDECNPKGATYRVERVWVPNPWGPPGSGYWEERKIATYEGVAKWLMERQPTAEGQEIWVPNDPMNPWAGSHPEKNIIYGIPHIWAGVDSDNKPIIEDLPATFDRNKTYVIAWEFTEERQVSNGWGWEYKKFTSYCKQLLSIVDKDPIHVLCGPKEKEKKIDATASCVYTFDQLDLTEPKGDDKCEPENNRPAQIMIEAYYGGKYNVFYNDEIDQAKFAAGEMKHYVTWIFRDNAGNESECQTTITINDKTAPIVDCDPKGVFASGKYVFTVSDDDEDCELKSKTFDDIFAEPRAFDECETHATGEETAIVPEKTRTYYETTEDKDANRGGVVITDWSENYKKGVTVLKYVFTDKAGNKAQCVLDIIVEDHTAPWFDCDDIDPLVVKPLAEGECEITFDQLNVGPYYATDYCSDPTLVPGALYKNEMKNSLIQDDYVFKVGVMDTLVWRFEDADGNTRFCPQFVYAVTDKKFDPNCDAVKEFSEFAEEGKCYAKYEDLNIVIPSAEVPCLPDSIIYGVPTRSDGLALEDDYPTGETIITWTFTHPATTDTAKCESSVKVKGNKEFDPVPCEILFPKRTAYTSDCGPLDTITLIPRFIPDPCISDYEAETVPYVDNVQIPLKGYQFPLGTTVVTWVYTDSTGYIKDTCYQDIEVLTELRLDGECPTGEDMYISQDQDTYIDDDGIERPSCKTVLSDVNKDKLKVGALKKENPCVVDEHGNKIVIEGVPYRDGGADLFDPYLVGTTKIIWVFEDTTHTMAHPKDTCIMYVRIGENEDPFIDCDRDLPSKDITLEEGCNIDFASFPLKIPAPVDPCSKEPADYSTTFYENYAGPASVGISRDSAETNYFLNTERFLPGSYRIAWDFVVSGQNYHCDQDIHIWDNVEPNIKCDTLGGFTVVLPEKLCEASSDTINSILDAHTPIAYEGCTGVEIPGVATLANGNPLPSKFKVGEDYTIRWIFKNDSLTKKEAFCDVPLKVLSSMQPLFDCDDLPDTVYVKVDGECEIVLTPTLLETPVAKEYCTGEDIPATGVRANGDEVYDADKPFPVGNTVITWTFVSPYSAVEPKTCTQVVNVRTSKEMKTACEKEDWQKTLNIDVVEGKCTVVSPFSTLEKPYAEHPCLTEDDGVTPLKIYGTPVRSDGKDINQAFRVGKTIVTWTFTDYSETLQVEQKTCEQEVVVGDINELPIDCRNMPDKLVNIPITQCEIMFADLNIKVPAIYDLCSGEHIDSVLTRTSGKGMDEPFEIGRDTVIWSYDFDGATFSCRQEIAVKSDVLKDFSCDLLASELNMTLTAVGTDSITYDELIDAGLKLPKDFITDNCDITKVTESRSDGLKLENGYPIGTTIITWFVADTTSTGDTIICTTKVNVVDDIVPEVTCPDINHAYFECAEDISAKFTSLDKFIEGGGKVNPKDKVKPETFTVVDTQDGTDKCDYMIHRKYSMLTIREIEVSCTQDFKIFDNIPPVWDAHSISDSKEFLCVADPIPSNYSATDACSGETYTMKEGPIMDGNMSGVYYKTETNRSDDPAACEYYSYFVKRTYVAYDNCKNASQPVVVDYTVIDTTAPEINVDTQWELDSVISKYAKGCVFLVPNIIDLLPDGAVSEDCNSEVANSKIEDLKKFGYKVYQTPTAGDTIDRSMHIHLFVEDACGNKDSVTKWVYVPTRKSVVDVAMHDTTICAESALSLNSWSIRTFGGTIWRPNLKGELKEYPSALMYDYYYGALDVEHLLFSQNIHTYSQMFAGMTSSERQKYMAEKIALDRMRKTGQYYIVAMDTLTLCADTSSAYITIHESPRVKLDPSEFSVCEDDSIRIEEDDLYTRFNVCVNEMGEPITEEGWMIGEDKYIPQTLFDYTSDKLKLVYYAENRCGVSTSYDSWYLPCEGEFDGMTDNEILQYLGGLDEFRAYEADTLKAKTSVELTVLERMKPDKIMLASNPQDKARVFVGESAELNLITNYDAVEYQWYRIEGVFDGRFGESFDRDGNIKPEFEARMDDPDEKLYVSYKDEPDRKHLLLSNLSDTASYYVLVMDGVCPAVVSNVVSMNVVKEIPTAFTPHGSVGLNDIFMEGYPVVIFNRYGQKMIESPNGWDGTCRGNLVDPGVYFYEVTLNNGVSYKGSIEVVYFK